MNAAYYKQKFDRERDRISHDLVRNIFFAGLQPCWDGTGRFGEQDVVYKSLLGDNTAKAIVAETMSAWRGEISPAILNLVKDVSGEFGFAPSEEWLKDVERIRMACVAISSFSAHDALAEREAHSKAKRFWGDCDTMYVILSAIKTDFAQYFERWDRRLISG